MAAPETWRAPLVVVRSQIVENCSFFSPPGAQLSVILTREPLGTYKAIILRTEFGGQREVVLSSESADTVNRAFELLLVKSADAVQNYITTNGFEFAPSSKKVQDVINHDVDEEDDDDDGVSSVLSSEAIDDDPPKGLADSTLSLSEAESAYESVSEDGIDVRYPRARATHTYSMRVRRSSSPRRPDGLAADFPREGGRQQQRTPPYYSPPHNFPIHRRRLSSPVRGSPPDSSSSSNNNPNAAGVDSPMGRHMPPPPPPLLAGGAPPAPTLWRIHPGAQMPPPVPHLNAMNIRAEPAGPPRPHPSQYFSLHPPPPPPRGMGMKLGAPIQPPPPGAMQQQQQHPQGRPPIGMINRDADGPPPMQAGPTIQAAAAAAAVPPPPPSSTSSPSSSLVSSASSTPTLTASPINKPPPPAAPTPAAIDYRLCIRSRGAAGAQAQAQAGVQQQQQWHEQRMVLHTPPTRTHVRAAALRFVEHNRDLFGHLGGGDGRHRQVQHQHQHQNSLRVALARAVLGDGESYDLSTYAGDDLSRLCGGVVGAAGQGAMPLFEVIVSEVGPVGPQFTVSLA